MSASPPTSLNPAQTEAVTHSGECPLLIIAGAGSGKTNTLAHRVRNILDFPALFCPPARLITLAQNYRSTQTIFDASNAVISLAAERFSKDLSSSRSQGEKPKLVTVPEGADQSNYIADEVLAARERGVPLKEQAVLFRTAHHSGPLEIELARHPIREVWRLALFGSGSRQGCPEHPALRREPV
jgi:superfamily I DNA/RNA helicase